MSQTLFGHTFTTYDEMVQESIDWYAAGLKMWKAEKRRRERRRNSETSSPPPLLPKRKPGRVTRKGRTNDVK